MDGISDIFLCLTGCRSVIADGRDRFLPRMLQICPSEALTESDPNNGERFL